jgi:hypothetical protein
VVNTESLILHFSFKCGLKCNKTNTNKVCSQVTTPLILPHPYFELHPGIMDQKCVKKAKCFVVFDLMIQKSNLSVQQSIMSIL